MIYHAKHGDEPDLYGLQDDVDKAIHRLTEVRDLFDGIAVQGMSGVIPGIPISLGLGCEAFILRKRGECRTGRKKANGQLTGTQRGDDGSHAWYDRINGRAVTHGSRWIFLDDFISSGATKRRVEEAIQSLGGQIIGVYTTRDGGRTIY